MICVQFSQEDNPRGSAPAPTFEQAAEIVRTEPRQARGSAPGLPLIGTAPPPPPPKPEPGQQRLFAD
ncbi:MAG: hypothetical protein JWL65_1536 [Gammaproteobacteria bacterium]|nr:hypothetical protein [Gammaproteobacteria bacterium]